MLFSFEIRRARKGDCLLLHYGSAADPRLAVIDGGPARVYDEFLEPRLDAIRAGRGAGALAIDLMMVSHIDDDHINGILDLTAKLKRAQQEGEPKPYDVHILWHNSFDDVIGDRPEDLVAAMHQELGTASTGGDASLIPVENDPELKAVLASVNQGRTLRDDAEALAIMTNAPFEGLVIARGDESSIVELDGDLKLTVVGPLLTELEELQKTHDKWLEKKGLGEPAPVADTLAAYSDKSAANLASIVALAESGGRRILLTGDARGDKILTGLTEAGLLEDGSTLEVDVLKVPHHGSDRNMEQGFFERVTAEHYVFSGDGEHGNPERKTFEMLFAARPAGGYKIHLTYPVGEIDHVREEEAHGWSDDEDSLAALFDRVRGDGMDIEITVAGGTAGTVIDLGEALSF